MAHNLIFDPWSALRHMMTESRRDTDMVRGRREREREGEDVVDAVTRRQRQEGTREKEEELMSCVAHTVHHRIFA